MAVVAIMVRVAVVGLVARVAVVALVAGRRLLRLTRKSERASGKLTKWPGASRESISDHAVEEQLIRRDTMSRGTRRKKNLEECKANVSKCTLG